MSMRKKKLLIEEDKEDYMARYKLGIFNKKDGRAIDLDSIIKLEKLDNLDDFTTEFKNETELKLYLFKQNLISRQELEQDINVSYRYNGKVKKISVFYQDMKKYLDIAHLRYELKGLCSNLEFLEKLANFYANGSTKFNKQGTNVNDIRVYLSDVRRNGGKTFYSKSLEIAIDDLFIKAVFDIDRQTGDTKEDYRGLRDLAYFIYKFKNEQKKKEEAKKEIYDIVGEQTSLFDKEYVEKIAATVEPKKDMSTTLDWNRDGEPEFPPNSEEEAEYLQYLDDLQNQEIDSETLPHFRR